MFVFNLFYLQIKKRIDARDYDEDLKSRILNKIIANVEESGIFDPPTADFEDEDFEDLEEEADTEFGCIVSREDLIKQKQIEYGIISVPKPDVQGKYGRERLHEAVSMGDLELVRRYLDEGDDASKKDNNGNTPYDLSILLENEDMINLFEEFGADF